MRKPPRICAFSHLKLSILRKSLTKCVVETNLQIFAGHLEHAFLEEVSQNWCALRVSRGGRNECVTFF